MVLGNYSKSNYNATPIVSKYGIAPAVRENHGQVTAITQEFEMNYEKSIRLGGLFDTPEGKHQAGSVWDRKALAPTIDTMKGGMRQPLIVVADRLNSTPPHRNKIPQIIRLCGLYGQATRWGVYDTQGIAPTITASMGMGGGHIPMIIRKEKI